MLFVFCFLFCFLPSAVWCLQSAVCHLLSGALCMLSTVCSLISVLYYIMPVIYYLLFSLCCLLPTLWSLFTSLYDSFCPLLSEVYNLCCTTWALSSTIGFWFFFFLVLMIVTWCKFGVLLLNAFDGYYLPDLLLPDIQIAAMLIFVTDVILFFVYIFNLLNTFWISGSTSLCCCCLGFYYMCLCSCLPAAPPGHCFLCVAACTYLIESLLLPIDCILRLLINRVIAY